MNDQNQRFELAEQLRRGARRHDRRRAVVTVVAIVAAIAGIGAFTAWQVSREDSAVAAVDDVPRHATDDFGFELTPALATDGKNKGEDAVTIDVWEDFLCPSCEKFHERTGDFLRASVARGEITIVYHPFVFLLEASTNRYAQRAANAAACVADDAGVVAYADMHDLLLENQPAEGTAGPADARLLQLAKKAGAGDIKACVEDEKFTPWIEAALEDGREREVSTTPTVRIGSNNIVNANGNMPGPAELKIAIEGQR